MSSKCNLSDTYSDSGSVEIVTELINKTGDLRSKFKGISFNYDLGRKQYKFTEEVYFFASMPPKCDKNIEIGSEIKRVLPIKKIYRYLTPGFSQPDLDILIKIIVECDCEYTRNGKTLCKSKYEIPFVLE